MKVYKILQSPEWTTTAAAAAKSPQSCLTLCDPRDGHPPALSLVFSRQEHWSGLPCPPPGDLPNPEIEPRSSALPADSLPLSHQGSPQILQFSSVQCLSHVRLFATS